MSNSGEWEYIEQYFGSTQNYLTFLSLLPSGIEVIPIHSLSLLHLYCKDEETLRELMSRGISLIAYIRIEKLTIGTRTRSIKPANIKKMLSM